jgi:hypothetical protein
LGTLFFLNTHLHINLITSAAPSIDIIDFESVLVLLQSGLVMVHVSTRTQPMGGWVSVIVVGERQIFRNRKCFNTATPDSGQYFPG